MPDSRTNILRAVAAAARLHKDFRSEYAADEGRGRIDVFQMFSEREVPLIFRPLRGLLGAYLDDPEPGVIVTTQRPLSVQRFTAAHELGHAILQHKTSLDDESMLARTPFVDHLTYDAQEAAADAFASELLIPQWLLAKHMLRQAWPVNKVTEPEIAYQLSLRLGVSFSALCHALRRHGIIKYAEWKTLSEVEPRKIKQRLAEGIEPKTWHGDVWVVTERDQGLLIEGSRTDLVVVKLPEHAASGYIWRFDELVATGMHILADTRVARGGQEEFGGIVDRHVVAQSVSLARGKAQLHEVRPWVSDAQPLKTISFGVDLYGPMTMGLLESERHQLLRVA